MEGNKLHYTIGEVAEILNESTSLVRFWSDTFPKFIKPSRNRKGNRMFSPEDVQNFKAIHYLVKTKGMTLDGANKKMAADRKGAGKNAEIVERLTVIKEQLKEISKSLSSES